MKAQHLAGDLIGKGELACGEILLCQRPAWIDAGVPYGACPFDADDVVLAARPLALVYLGLYCGKIPLRYPRRWDDAVALIARLPWRQPEQRPHVIAAGLPVVAGVG